jgi:hypothetical protein
MSSKKIDWGRLYFAVVVIGVVVTSAVSAIFVHTSGAPHTSNDLLEYLAYILPCLGGIVIGGGLYYEKKEKHYYAASVVAILGGMMAYTLRYRIENWRVPTGFVVLLVVMVLIAMLKSVLDPKASWGYKTITVVTLLAANMLLWLAGLFWFVVVLNL